MIYTPDDYTEHHVLKVQMTLVFATIYLLKHFLIFALPAISDLPFVQKFAHEQLNFGLLLVSLPAVAVIVSMSRRLPHSGSTIRWLWQRGRILLLTSIILEIGLILFYVFIGFKKFNETNLIFLYIDFAVLVFLMKSQRVKDVFAEFPAYEKKK